MKHAEENRMMFDKIAHGYDRTNTIISLGRYNSWLSHLVRTASISNNSKVLDCATGTGNLAIRFKTKYPNSSVIGIDVSEEMISIARTKSKNKALDIEYINADILDLPFESNSFDVASISFGIRNTESFDKCLKEMSRVVKTAGRVLILETARLVDFRQPVYGFVQKLFIRPVGEYLTGDLSAYDWLSDSSNRFPAEKEFIQLMKSTQCFSSIDSKSFMFGAVCLYTGIVK